MAHSLVQGVRSLMARSVRLAPAARTVTAVAAVRQQMQRSLHTRLVVVPSATSSLLHNARVGAHANRICAFLFGLLRTSISGALRGNDTLEWD